jgi:hypothetical protein
MSVELIARFSLFYFGSIFREEVTALNRMSIGETPFEKLGRGTLFTLP